jgi:hypothetical protein
VKRRHAVDPASLKNHVHGHHEDTKDITPAIYAHQKALLNLAYNFVFDGT